MKTRVFNGKQLKQLARTIACQFKQKNSGFELDLSITEDIYLMMSQPISLNSDFDHIPDIQRYVFD